MKEGEKIKFKKLTDEQTAEIKSLTKYSIRHAFLGVAGFITGIIVLFNGSTFAGLAVVAASIGSMWLSGYYQNKITEVISE